jgi:hypothetical protein
MIMPRYINPTGGDIISTTIFKKLVNTVKEDVLISSEFVSPYIDGYFLGQNEIHFELMSWPLVRVSINFSLNIFFSETTTPRYRGQIFLGMFLGWSSLKFGYGISNTGSEKLPKIA